MNVIQKQTHKPENSEIFDGAVTLPLHQVAENLQSNNLHKADRADSWSLSINQLKQPPIS